jgi:hypothetical protein
VAELEGTRFPVVTRTVEESSVYVASQGVVAEELQDAIMSEDTLLIEGEKRCIREEGALKELERDMQAFTDQLIRRQKEHAIKDQTCKDLFSYCASYSQLIQDLFGIRLEYVVPPSKHMTEWGGILDVVFQGEPDRHAGHHVTLYFSGSCSLVQVKVGEG